MKKNNYIFIEATTPLIYSCSIWWCTPQKSERTCVSGGGSMEMRISLTGLIFSDSCNFKKVAQNDLYVWAAFQTLASVYHSLPADETAILIYSLSKEDTESFKLSQSLCTILSPEIGKMETNLKIFLLKCPVFFSARQQEVSVDGLLSWWGVFFRSFTPTSHG